MAINALVDPLFYWAGGITAVGGAITMFVKLWQWFKREKSKTAAEAASQAKLVSELMSKAISSDRRMEILAYLQIRCIEFEGERTRHAVLASVIWIMFLIMLATLGILVAIDFFKWGSAELLLMTGAIACLVPNGIVWHFYVAKIFAAESGWHDRARDLLQHRAFND